jgi:hypothetical protein
MSRCPLTDKFGRDVAGLIYQRAWMNLLTLVNVEFHASFEERLVYGTRMTLCLKPRWHILHRSCASKFFNVSISNFVTQNPIVAKLPLNYWNIKELY